MSEKAGVQNVMSIGRDLHEKVKMQVTIKDGGGCMLAAAQVADSLALKGDTAHFLTDDFHFDKNGSASDPDIVSFSQKALEKSLETVLGSSTTAEEDSVTVEVKEDSLTL